MTTTLEKPPLEPLLLQAPDFKAVSEQLVDSATETDEMLLLTQNGQPVLKLEQCPKQRQPLRGKYRGQIKILGDIISPICDSSDGKSDPS